MKIGRRKTEDSPSHFPISESCAVRQFSSPSRLRNPTAVRARARSLACVRRCAPAANQAARSPRSPGSRARPRAEWGWGLGVNGRVNGGGRGVASRMNERNVPRARRRARPGLGANGNAGRAQDPALRATAARRLEDERRRAGARVAGRAWSVRGPRAASQRPDGTAGRRRPQRRRQ